MAGNERLDVLGSEAALDRAFEQISELAGKR